MKNIRFILATGILLIGVGGCSDYGLQRVLADAELDDLLNCTNVVGDRYWYQNHEFGVVMIYGGCEPEEYNAYLLIDHDYQLMDMEWTTAGYVTSNGDLVTVEAVQYTLGFWYNPADIELTVVPFSGGTALGIYEFWVDCVDDDDTICDIEYRRDVGTEDFQ